MIKLPKRNIITNNKIINIKNIRYKQCIWNIKDTKLIYKKDLKTKYYISI